MTGFYGLPLQPRPDRFTGLPRPKNYGVDTGRPKKGKALDPPTRPPPPGYGPALEWSYVTRADATLFFLYLCIIVAIFASILSHGLSWMANPVYWIVFGVMISIGLVRGGRIDRECGADWYRVGSWAWIDLYDIQKVIGSKDIRQSGLNLTDSSGRFVVVDWQGSPRAMWLLIENGIEHSVANGAYMNEGARTKFLNLEYKATWRGLRRK